MKKLILISAIAATTLFAEGLADIATKAATDQAKSEVTKVTNEQIDKVAGTKKEEAKEAEAPKDANSTEKSKA